MGKRLAFLVGINDYGLESGLFPLNYAEADVKLMAETLRTSAGFLTKNLVGDKAKHDEIMQGLKPYYKERDIDIFLFYFAGHGELIPKVGQHCLHCYGSEKSDAMGTLNIKEWALRIKRKISARHIILVVDACQNSFFRGYRALDIPGLSSSVPLALKGLSNQPGSTRGIIDGIDGSGYVKQDERLLFTLLACGPGQVSFEDDELEHGIFTYALAKEIKANSHKLSLREISKRVAEFTIERCRNNHLSPEQIPEWIGPLRSEDFLLVDTFHPILPEYDGINGKAVSNVYEAHPSPYGSRGYVRRYENGSIYFLKEVGKPKRKLTKIEAKSAFRLCDSNIEARYESLGGSRSVLGFPIEEVQDAWKNLNDTLESPDRVQAFEGGNIYFRGGCGAHAILKGGIKELIKSSEQELLEKQDKQATGGVFGFPVSEQMEVTSLSKKLGHAQRFECGLIVDWNCGVFGITGKFYDLYRSLGEWNGPPGFPESDEQPIVSSITGSTGRVQIFEHGCIIWNDINDKCIYIEEKIFLQWHNNRSKFAFPISSPYPVETRFEQLFEGGKIFSESTDIRKNTSVKKGAIKKESIASPADVSLGKPGEPLNLSAKQSKILRRVHEKISGNLSSLLNFYLSTKISVEPHSLEALTYEKFISSFPSRTYMTAISMKPSDKVSVLAVNSKLLFSMIDILSKTGASRSRKNRTITNMDRGVIAGLIRTILESLEEGWQEVASFNMSVLQVEASPGSLALLMAPEQMVSISFGLTVGTVDGLMLFGIPYSLLQ